MTLAKGAELAQERFEQLLDECGWRMHPDLVDEWTVAFYKGVNRIEVDHIGIFLFTRRGPGWVRRAGQSFDSMEHLEDRRLILGSPRKYVVDLVDGRTTVLPLAAAPVW